MKKNRIFSVILVVSMLCANLFSSILSVNASALTLTETVILNEDFEISCRINCGHMILLTK